MKSYVEPSLLEWLQGLKAANNKSLWEDFGMVLAEPDKKFNPELHPYGIYIVDELLLRNELLTSEIDIVLEENLKKPFFTYDAIYFLYFAGKIKYEGALQALLKIIRRGLSLIDSNR
ncbi:hypothetical protein [Cytobacillus sp. FSL K6-0265]|uniref:hypothetical protein n=1 Tax=Cytobacillus sp. FSL K6-0265 TaxID=2921448 RepID=UPI0030F7549A